MLKVLSDILLAIDSGDLSALVLLDLSAAFDTVDHDILLRRLDKSYAISVDRCCTGSRLTWSVVGSTSGLDPQRHPRHQLRAVYHRGQYLDPFFSYCTPPTLRC